MARAETYSLVVYCDVSGCRAQIETTGHVRNAREARQQLRAKLWQIGKDKSESAQSRADLCPIHARQWINPENFEFPDT